MDRVVDDTGASWGEHYRPIHTLHEGAMKLTIIALPCTLGTSSNTSRKVYKASYLSEMSSADVSLSHT